MGICAPSRIDYRRLPASVLGPDSILPRPEDVIQAFHHLKWMIGKGPLPEFDRWTYWEKFDYLGVVWGICVLGSTGLILYNPAFSSRYMPGWVFNVLLWVHRIEAVLAIAHVFTIHFFIGHLRKHNFPMDLTMFSGSSDLETTRHERPARVARLKSRGVMKKVLVKGHSPLSQKFFYTFGFIVVGVCFYLLGGGLWNGMSLIRFFFYN